MSARTQSPQRGLCAVHTRRPCRMSRRLSAPRSSARTIGFNSSSTFTGSVFFVSPSRRDSRSTWVSTGRPGSPMATLRTTLPVLRPTPGRVTRSDSLRGTSPPNRSTRAVAMPMRLRVLFRKKPVDWMICSSSAGSAAARSSGRGYLPNTDGVTMLTRSSVVCADRIVATSSSYGLECSSAHRSLAVPGYSSARRSATTRARPLGLRGLPVAITAGHYRPLVPASLLQPRRMTRASRRVLTVAAVSAFAALVLALGQAPDNTDVQADTGGRSATSAGDTTAVADRDEPDAPGGPSPAPPKVAEARGDIVEPPPRSFTLVATGDVLLHTALWDQARADAAAAGRAGHDFGPMLSGIQPVVSAADLAICHMETPVAPPGGPFSSYPSFSVPREIAPALAATGYDACTTASNHTYDRGADGVDRTLDALDSAGIQHAGSARTPDEATAVTLLDAGVARVALLSYTYSFNGVPPPNGQAWRSNPIDEAKIVADAAAARARGADVVVVSLHWGDEYRHEPNAQQLDLAPRLIRSPDIDLLLGHHAHVVQPLERIDGEWVVYGLGNLVAHHDTLGAANEEGLLVRFTFTEPDRPAGRWRVNAAEYAPVLVLKDRLPVRVV